MIAAPSPSSAPAWVNDHRHAGHKGTYFAGFPEKRASLWGCSLCSGPVLPPGSWEQHSLPLEMVPSRRATAAPSAALPAVCPARAAAAREKAARTTYCTVVSSRMLRPHHLLQLLTFREIRLGLGLGLEGLPPPGGRVPWRGYAWQTHAWLSPASVTARQAPRFPVPWRISHSSSPALWKAFGRGSEHAGPLFALSDNQLSSQLSSLYLDNG